MRDWPKDWKSEAATIGAMHLIWVIPVVLLLLAGCQISLDRAVTVAPPDYYTRAEVDAINAELECRLLARSLLQASRCGVRR